MNIIQTSPRFSNQYYNRINNDVTQPRLPIFKGAPAAVTKATKQLGPIGKFSENVENNIASVFGKMIQSKPAEKLVKGTMNSPKWIKDNMFAHLIVLGSTALSGAYVVKTLRNDKLDERKRKTLAINQAAVFGVSTVMAYTFDKALGKWTNNLIDKFKKINAGNPHLDKYVNGIKIAKTTIIIDMVYRFIAPVAVTPVANHFGNKIEIKSKAKMAPENK